MRKTMTSKNKQLIIVAAIASVLLITIFVAGCTSNSSGSNTATPAPGASAAPNQTVVLRTTTTTGSVTLIDIAEAKGYFAQQGVTIQSVGNVNGGTQSVQALIAGQADIAGSAWPPWINAASGNPKLTVVVASQGQNENETGELWLVHKNSSIYTAQDLIGKKIAVNVLGAEGDYVTRDYLAKSNISIKQVQLVVVPWPQHEQVFESNQVDVVSVNQPFANKILADGDARVLFSDYTDRGETALFVYGFTQDYIDKNPATVKGFVTAMAEAADWAVANPADANALASSILVKEGMNPTLASYWSPSQAWPHALIHDSDVQWWLDTLTKSGTIKAGSLQPSDLYTNQYNPNYTG
jgi:ABC-type nitrate/sulfonate/bicarbonate transport system substrate-binding protein